MKVVFIDYSVSLVSIKKMSMKKLLLIPALLLGLFVSAQVTVTFQPHFNGNEGNIQMADSTAPGWLSMPTPHRIDTAYPTYPIMSYMAWTASGGKIYTRNLLKFADLSTIPSGSTITSAKLFLYGIPSAPTGDFGNSTYSGSPYNTYGTNRGWIYELAAPFSTTTTWRTQPSYLHTDSVAIPASNSRWSADDSMDVTALVAHMFVSGNHGFIIKLDTEVNYRERLFASSRYSDTTMHPALRVTYVPPASVKNIAGVPYVKLAPNPAHARTTATIYSGRSAEVNIGIYNAVGTRVHIEKLSLSEGVNTVDIGLEALPDGLYVFELQASTGTVRQKFVKQ
jgi:hypothetical protein